MNQPKPEWHLAGYLVPPIIGSLMLLCMYPSYLFTGLILLTTLTIGLKLGKLLLFKHAFTSHMPAVASEGSIHFPSPIYGNEAVGEGSLHFPSPIYGRGVRGEGLTASKIPPLSYSFKVLSLVFLSGLSLLAFIFLTATNQLAPEELAFNELAKLWETLFPLGIGLLIVHIILQSFLPKKPSANLKNTSETTLLCTQLFFNFSSFLALIIGLGFAIFIISSAITRIIGIDLSSSLQLQSIMGSTVIILPFLTKRWKERRFKKLKLSRRKQLLILSLILVICLPVLEVITLPFYSQPIPLSFITAPTPSIIYLYWKLFVLSWWLALAPLLAQQIISWSRHYSACRIFLPLLLATICVYLMVDGFLKTGGNDYFLTVIRQGIPALVLTALPLAALMLTSIKYQGSVFLVTKRPDIRQQNRHAKYLSHSLIQGISLVCALFWATGFSILLPCVVMCFIPSVMLFLVI